MISLSYVRTQKGKWPSEKRGEISHQTLNLLALIFDFPSELWEIIAYWLSYLVYDIVTVAWPKIVISYGGNGLLQQMH